MSNISSDRIGRLGERKFDDLCDRAGLAVSVPSPDMTGKDRHVEFPFVEPVGFLTFDTRPAPLACYVQVKTLFTKYDRFEMRLSAAERLARESKPSFVAVLRIDDNSDFADMYLVHVSGEVLAKILKRLRAEQAKGSTHLNIKKITFSISTGLKVNLAPDTLREALSSAIGHDMVAYTVCKHRQLKELGYDTARFEGKVTFGPLKFERFIDGLLGLSELPVMKLENFERRFDIRLPSPPDVPEAQDGKFHVMQIKPRASDRCTVTVKSLMNDEIATIEGDIYFPALQNLPKEFRRFLVRTDLFDLTLNDKGLNVKQREGCRAAVEILYQSYRMLKLLSEGECLITLKSHRTLMETPLPPCRLDGGPDFGWVGDVLEVIDAAMKLRKLAGAKDNPISLEDLGRGGREIICAHAFMTGQADSASLKFTTDSAPEGVQLEQAPFIFISAVIIGDEPYAFALRTMMTPNADRGFVQWTSDKPEPLMVEQLGANPSDNYRLFAEKITRISGINNLIQRNLVCYSYS